MIDSKIGSMKGSDIMLESDINARFNEIYDSTNKPVLAFITTKCGNTADISDIFQDTYMELYQLMSKRGTEYITDDKALVLKIAKRKIARYYSVWKRLQMFVPMTIKNDENEEIEYLELSDADVNSFLTEDFAVNQVMLDSIRQFIRQKPEDVKKVFYLFYEMDMSIPEIALSLFLSESSVKNKLYRTIKELKNLLK